MENNPMLSNLEMPLFQESLDQSLINRYIKEFDNRVKEAMIQKGIDPNNIEQLKGRLSCISQDSDPYEHYFLDYGQPSEIRILSIQKQPEFAFDGVKMSLASKYY